MSFINIAAGIVATTCSAGLTNLATKYRNPITFIRNNPKAAAAVAFLLAQNAAAFHMLTKTMSPEEYQKFIELVTTSIVAGIFVQMSNHMWDRSMN
jgi:hypothetical protein